MSSARQNVEQAEAVKADVWLELQTNYVCKYKESYGIVILLPQNSLSEPFLCLSAVSYWDVLSCSFKI